MSARRKVCQEQPHPFPSFYPIFPWLSSVPTLRLRVVPCSTHQVLGPAVVSLSSNQHLYRVGKTVASRVADEPKGSRPIAPQVAHSGELAEKPRGLKGALTRRRGGGTGGEMREEKKG